MALRPCLGSPGNRCVRRHDRPAARDIGHSNLGEATSRARREAGTPSAVEARERLGHANVKAIGFGRRRRQLATPAKNLADAATLLIMANHSSHILEMARKGAEHKYEELKAEIAALVKSFPHLAGRARAAVSRGVAALSKGEKPGFPAAAGEVTPRKRRKMSAKARKAIGDAQRKRWAEQRAGAKK
jgi:hypothetical protein